MEFTHIDERGNARMVDVSEKRDTLREASAAGCIFMSRECFEKLAEGIVQKGDVLGTCHILNLTKLSVDFELLPEECAVRAVCTAGTTGKTGVEMEALTGVNIALLTVYDMCKAIDKSMEIGRIRLLRKSGGKSGDYVNPAGGNTAK